MFCRLSLREVLEISQLVSGVATAATRAAAAATISVLKASPDFVFFAFIAHGESERAMKPAHSRVAAINQRSRNGPGAPPGCSASPDSGYVGQAPLTLRLLWPDLEVYIVALMSKPLLGEQHFALGDPAPHNLRTRRRGSS